MNSFVFVVCGAKEFIEELNFSLKFLRHYSNYPIIVLTDSKRNEIPIEHDNIIDIETPSELKNHQAHLYLETKLPLYVKPENDDCYCYLDSDVIAISTDINNIFKHFTPPVSFAPDHCTIDYFSSGVMYCNCVEEFRIMEEKFHFMKNYFPQFNSDDKQICKKREELKTTFNNLRINPFKNSLQGLKYFVNRYLIRPKEFKLNGDFYFSFKDYCWRDVCGNLLDYDYRHYKVRLKRKYKILVRDDRWFDHKNRELIPQAPHCSHLREHIKKHYHISIPAEYQHWNGGVFIFDKSAIDFFRNWHDYTMLEIKRKKIKPYDDQGTLAVCAWKFGIQNKNTIPIKYNFITDYGNQSVKYEKSKGFTYNNFKTVFNPSFLHVYNQWGNKDWDIWQAVIEIGMRNKII